MGKEKVAIVVCVCLILLLASLNYWFYTSIARLQSQLSTFKSECDRQKDRISILETQINSLKEQMKGQILELRAAQLHPINVYWTNNHSSNNSSYILIIGTIFNSGSETAIDTIVTVKIYDISAVLLKSEEIHLGDIYGKAYAKLDVTIPYSGDVAYITIDISYNSWISKPSLKTTIYGTCLGVRQGPSENWGENAFMLYPEVRQLAKEGGMKIIRQATRPSLLALDDVVNICKLIRELGAEPLIILPERIFPLEDRVESSVAIVQKLGDLCRLYEVGNEPHIYNVTPEEYAVHFREIVTACRQINPEAYFGGPVCSLPWLSPSKEFYEVLVRECKDLLHPNDSFISFHYYCTSDRSQESSDVILERSTHIYGDAVRYLKNLTNTILGYELKIACTEFNLRSSPEDRIDLDETFITAFTQNAMKDMAEAGIWISLQFNFCEGNYLSMIDPYTRTPKPQYYAFKEVATS